MYENETTTRADGPDPETTEGRPIRTRTPKKLWKPAFLIALARTGNPAASARAAGVARSTVCEARQTDEKFAADWADIIEELADDLEEKARKMALAGDARVLLATLRALRPDRWGERARAQVDVQHAGTVAATLTADPQAVADHHAQLARLKAIRSGQQDGGGGATPGMADQGS